jgi:predicted RNase H-like HicB family nuclease
MHDAMDAHLKSMREDGDPIPSPSYVADMLEVV